MFVQAFVAVPRLVAPSAVGLGAFAVMWVLLRLRRWLDPAARTWASLRWALSSRSLNWLIAWAFLTVVANAMLSSFVGGDMARDGQRWPDAARFVVAWWLPVLLTVGAAITSIGFLCVHNPDTLARDPLERWWRPFWPGIAGLALGRVGWDPVAPGPDWLAAHRPQLLPTQWRLLSVPAFVASHAIGLSIDLVVLAFWFPRSRPSDVKAMASALFRWSTVKGAIGFDVFMSACARLITVPVLALIVLDQMCWQIDASGMRTSTAWSTVATCFGWLRGIPGMDVALFPGMLLSNALIGLAWSRLLYRHAVPEGEGVPRRHG